ncbi:hypothetical protein EA004_18955 [Vibrio anguillarum]|uniref:Lipoprotein n=2 Tax=Vibrio anguillarum TaxID=55601 RepID=A0ABR9Z9S7_VIBAN|nr:hypothetical protein [Vibrio anguillarum]MBF4375200.1 hypothetical protein [Vibrio anguillarum]
MRFISLLFVFFLSGCSMALDEMTSSYEEAVTGFYLVKGKNEVFIQGKKYNYLFTVSEKLYGALTLNSGANLQVNFSDFSIDEENTISGSVELYIKREGLLESNVKIIENLGFKTHPLYPEGSFELNENVIGTVYKSDKSAPLSNTNKEHLVLIKVPDSAFLKTSKLVAAPFAITFDVLVVLPVYVVILYVGS